MEVMDVAELLWDRLWQRTKRFMVRHAKSSLLIQPLVETIINLNTAGYHEFRVQMFGMTVPRLRLWMVPYPHGVLLIPSRVRTPHRLQR